MGKCPRSFTLPIDQHECAKGSRPVRFDRCPAVCQREAVARRVRSAAKLMRPESLSPTRAEARWLCTLPLQPLVGLIPSDHERIERRNVDDPDPGDLHDARGWPNATRGIESSAGFSLGGLAAACIAVSHAEVFGNALARSGSFYRPAEPEALAPDCEPGHITHPLSCPLDCWRRRPFRAATPRCSRPRDSSGMCLPQKATLSCTTNSPVATSTWPGP